MLQNICQSMQIAGLFSRKAPEKGCEAGKIQYQSLKSAIFCQNHQEQRFLLFQELHFFTKLTDFMLKNDTGSLLSKINSQTNFISLLIYFSACCQGVNFFSNIFYDSRPKQLVNLTAIRIRIYIFLSVPTVPLSRHQQEPEQKRNDPQSFHHQ